MRILAIDSSGLVASVAIVENEETLAEYTVNYKKTHSQTLLPMLDEVVKMVELDLNLIDAIAVAGGPGSFTGLRIGSATAKGLGMALEKPLIHVPTVDALAYNLYGVSGIICPIMDARRNQVYTGLYQFECEEFKIIESQMAIEVQELIKKLNQKGMPVVFLGDGVPVYKKELMQGLLVPFSFAPAHMNRQRAASLGTLGMEYYKKGKMETAMEHQPDYLRVSQAERERLEREKLKKEQEN
ncbi:MAG: tRNA (adenosine(37)-N6)-threonylcarbamoyltransferase complex dimerization subunit type 1 TsaB [Lachnospiraceae bacterium]|nr:tRNA (adenosine(37)-N6)-threonylcarbamoyltransferase complex dimerization subunit type 1 TsaB [Lachnospiraceae bacterium]